MERDNWIRISLEDWQAKGRELFGDDANFWRFVCPSCGQVQTRQDFLNLGMHPRQVDQFLAYSCIGRWNVKDRELVVDFCEETQGAGCTFAGGGLYNISPYTIIVTDGEDRPTFGFDHASVDRSSDGGPLR